MGGVFISDASPAGLIAALACEKAGVEPTIWTESIRSRDIPSVEYLVDSLPLVHLDTQPDAILRTERVGDAGVYAFKLRNSSVADMRAVVEFEGLPSLLPVWSLRATYEALHTRYIGKLRPRPLWAYDVEEVFKRLDPELLIWVSPLRSTCVAPGRHKFETRRYIYAPKLLQPMSDWTLRLNGDPDIRWCRQIAAFGAQRTEWLASELREQMPPLSGITEEEKPYETFCSCWNRERRFLPIGPLGAWSATVGLETIYPAVTAAMARLKTEMKTSS